MFISHRNWMKCFYIFNPKAVTMRSLFRPLFLFFAFAMALFFIFGLMEETILPRKILSPTPFSVQPLYPSGMSLLNLKQFAYIINNDVCKKDDVYMIVIVHSHPANRNRRDAMRKTIPHEDLVDLNVRRVFLFARAEWNDQELYKRTPQDTISEENIVHGDIVQGDFKEHYHNLTYKHIMGLQWTTKYCPQAKYILKMDDDIIVDLYQFREKLRYRYRSRTNLILGLLQIEAYPVRNKESKWYVDKNEFPGNIYPNFVSGWAYAMSMDAAIKIVSESSRHRYFWIDDAFITGVLAEAAGVKREGFNQMYTLHAVHLKCCIELPHYKEYLCDFFAGPSEGDVKLMEDVLSHARYCFINSCTRRTREISIAKTCVTALNPFDPLGIGQGEVIKVF